MDIDQVYSHLNGYEWLMHHHPALWDEVVGIIKSVDANSLKTKESKEKGMEGKLLYSPIEINSALKEGFVEAGWKEERASYWVTTCLLYTSPSPRDRTRSRMPSSA